MTVASVHTEVEMLRERTAELERLLAGTLTRQC